MNQLTLAAIAAVVVAGGAFTLGWRTASDHRDAQLLREARVADTATQAATRAAVDQIKKIRIERVTVRQELEREIHMAPASVDCNISDGVRDALNRALAPPGSPRTGVPGPDAPAR